MSNKTLNAMLNGKTNISWTDTTWNPATGCTSVSEACVNCYAREIVEHGRLKGHPRYPNGFGTITEHQDKIPDKPPGRGKAKRIFVCDMGDLFHEDITPKFFNKIFDVIRAHPQHTFQLLTKRSQRLNIVDNYPVNCWVGVTCESNKHLDRIDHLAATNARVKFVSAEPLLEEFRDFDWLTKIDWLIVGGESGDNRRRFDPVWARELRAASRQRNVAYFFKQHGNKKDGDNDKLLDGEQYHEFPI